MPCACAPRLCQTLVLIIEGSVADWTESQSAAIAAGIATFLEVEPGDVDVSAEAASIRLTIVVAAQDATHAASITSALAEPFSSAAAATDFFSSVGVDVKVTSIEEAPEAPSADRNPMVYVAAGVGGGAVVLLLVFAVGRKWMRPKSMPKVNSV